MNLHDLVHHGGPPRPVRVSGVYHRTSNMLGPSIRGEIATAARETTGDFTEVTTNHTRIPPSRDAHDQHVSKFHPRGKVTRQRSYTPLRPL